jgi:predicted adenylyl cyclase CyaB
MQQKLNLELKHFCDDFRKVRQVLTSIGAEKEEIKKQKDYFFNTPKLQGKTNPRLKLRIEGEKKTLIYYERPAFSAGTDTQSVVEILNISDVHTLPFLEKALGVRGVVEKTREVWRKDYTVFHLDTIRGVGKICEVELQKQGSITQKDRDVFSYYQEVLMPVLGKMVKGSNIDLVLKK